MLYLNGSSFNAHLLACVPKDGATSLLVNLLEDMENIIPNLQAEDGLNVLKYLSIRICSQFEYLINTEEWGISPQAQPPDLQLLFKLEELALWKLDTFNGICAGALTTFSWACFPKLRRLEKLTVFHCEQLEQVFDFGHEGKGMKLLSSLRDLTLWDYSSQHVQLCNLRSMSEVCQM
ncbi:unnamed protein product [Camellia sinensis]